MVLSHKMVCKGSIFSGRCWNSPSPYLNGTTVLFDTATVNVHLSLANYSTLFHHRYCDLLNTTGYIGIQEKLQCIAFHCHLMHAGMFKWYCVIIISAAA